MVSGITDKVRGELRVAGEKDRTQNFQRFFKEEVKCYGLKTPFVMKVASGYWKEIRALDKSEIFGLCEELYSPGYTEEAFIASAWAERTAERFEESDIKIFRNWIDRYIDNWAKCDGLCNHAVGDYIVMYPHRTSDLKEWARSENRWLRRAAAVSLIVPAKKGLFLEDSFEIADILLEDGDDMVRKGYGWLLKDSSIVHRDEVFEYVMKNRDRMPRTALRYAIERMPKELRAEAMKRG